MTSLGINVIIWHFIKNHINLNWCDHFSYSVIDSLPMNTVLREEEMCISVLYLTFQFYQIIASLRICLSQAMTPPFVLFRPPTTWVAPIRIAWSHLLHSTCQFPCWPFTDTHSTVQPRIWDRIRSKWSIKLTIHSCLLLRLRWYQNGTGQTLKVELWLFLL